MDEMFTFIDDKKAESTFSLFKIARPVVFWAGRRLGSHISGHLASCRSSSKSKLVLQRRVCSLSMALVSLGQGWNFKRQFRYLFGGRG